MVANFWPNITQSVLASDSIPTQSECLNMSSRSTYITGESICCGMVLGWYIEGQRFNSTFSSHYSSKVVVYGYCQVTDPFPHPIPTNTQRNIKMVHTVAHLNTQQTFCWWQCCVKNSLPFPQLLWFQPQPVFSSNNSVLNKSNNAYVSISSWSRSMSRQVQFAWTDSPQVLGWQHRRQVCQLGF